MTPDQVVPAAKAPPRGRLVAGVTVFIAAQVLPFFTSQVLPSDLSEGTKAVFSGLVTLVLGEIGTLASVAILGKPGFEWVKGHLMRWLKGLAPSAKVGRARYRTGIFILSVLIILTLAEPYLAGILPGYGEHRRLYVALADILFVVNLFILGGDFWDKLRALFVYEAKVTFRQG